MQDSGASKRIRLTREKLGLSQTEFAQRIGRKRLSVIRYESGRIPRADILDRIARLSGVTVAWLLHGTDQDLPRELRRAARSKEGERSHGLFASPPKLPSNHRRRYQARVNELTVRLQRELDEYRRLLELEYRSRGGRRRARW